MPTGPVPECIQVTIILRIVYRDQKWHGHSIHPQIQVQMPGAQKCGHDQGNEVGVDRHNQSYKVDKFGEYE